MQTQFQKAYARRKAARARYLRHRHELYLAWKARQAKARRVKARKQLKRAA